MTQGTIRRLGFAVAVAAASATVYATVGTAAGTASPPVNSSPPTISGTPTVGQTLTANNGSWSGANPMTFTYQWQRCDSTGGSCADVASATSQTYTIQSADAGHTLRVKVTATNADGTGGPVLSNPTAEVAATTAPANTAVPQITGTLTAGQTLTVSTGTWTGTAPITYTFEWQRCNAQGVNCAAIAGATSATYTLTSADTGNRIQALVTAKNSGGSASKYSNQTGQVGSNVAAPANTTAPLLSGSPVEGQTLQVSSGNWSGTGPITVAYQWQRCNAQGVGCAPIAGVIGQTYALAKADVGARLQVLVTARNAGGDTGKYSNQSAVVTASGASAPAGTVAGSTVNLPDRLIVDKIQYPGGGHSRTPFTARFHVSDTAKHSVSGALVYVVGLPYGWIRNLPEQATDATGWVTLTLNPTLKMPRTGSLVMFVRARTPQGDPLAGASTRRLVQVRVRP